MDLRRNTTSSRYGKSGNVDKSAIEMQLVNSLSLAFLLLQVLIYVLA
jgi:hypothetical protein